jgi:hypothetical protein
LPKISQVAGTAYRAVSESGENSLKNQKVIGCFGFGMNIAQ